MALPARLDEALAASAPQLDFAVEDARAIKYAAVPTLGFDVSVARRDGGSVRSLSLTVQLRIAATRRSYAPSEREGLLELFGRPEQWSRSVRSLLWTNASAQVPGFTASTTFELQVPCTYDLEVTASRYLNALEGGEVPLELLFGGTMFYSEASGRLQVASISWDREAEYRLPVAVWRDMMDQHFGGRAWLRLRRGTFDRLAAYKARGAFASWEGAVDDLLSRADGRPGEG
jgi:Family of unknown function (DUF6084)